MRTVSKSCSLSHSIILYGVCSDLFCRRWRTHGTSTAGWREMWTGWSQPCRDRWTAAISLRSVAQWSLLTHTHTHKQSFTLMDGCVWEWVTGYWFHMHRQRILCGWYLFRGSCIGFKLKTIFWQNRWFFISNTLPWYTTNFTVFCVCFCFLYEQQEKVQIRKELWRIEDVIAGLSNSKANYKVTISSITNPGETHATWRFHVYKVNYICRLCNAVQAQCGHAAVSRH